MTEQRNITPVTVTLDRQRPYRVNDSDRDAVWVGPGSVQVPRWVAEAWKMIEPEQQQRGDELPKGDDLPNATVTVNGVDVPGTIGYTAPFEGYDDMNAAAIIERLPNMALDEREAVRSYESANKGRQTILKALDR